MSNKLLWFTAVHTPESKLSGKTSHLLTITWDGRLLRSKSGVLLLFPANYFNCMSAETVKWKNIFGFLGGVFKSAVSALHQIQEPAFSLKEVTLSPRTSAPPLQASAASSSHDAPFRFQLCCSFNLGTHLSPGRIPWCELSAARIEIQTPKSKTEDLKYKKKKSASQSSCL